MTVLEMLQDNDLCAAVQRNSPIDAIKRYREMTNCKYKEARLVINPQWDALRLAAFAPNV